jgi:hypothetical protein
VPRSAIFLSVGGIRRLEVWRFLHAFASLAADLPTAGRGFRHWWGFMDLEELVLEGLCDVSAQGYHGIEALPKLKALVLVHK